ncbi:GH32 C-terminal domain-containing protein [Gaoshiqia sediminis]|uniref:beta-fructofuranosidase n=1 Tax=Gaoshiqia sediminis TaxID=2986998 RepID=A0AA41Y981_9BACT|nr:GH32 C-terminal domain-containing protein [Gaoshiqia sediminis]MCW0484449.1 GH32 C-terminal domain-containing protein [Gaoshiqia sediminis]
MKLINKFYLAFFVSLTLSCGKNDEPGPPVIPPVETIKEIVAFEFNETTGTTTVESITNNSYEILGNSVNRMPGVKSNALFFDGLSSQIPGNIPSNILPGSQFCLSLWASPKSYPIGTAAMLAMTSEGSNTGIMVGINRFGQIVIQYYLSGIKYEHVTSESLPRDMWSFIMVGISPKSRLIKVFINSRIVINTTIPVGNISWPVGTTPFSIGKNTSGEKIGIYDVDYFSGAIDELLIYSGQLSQEIADSEYGKYTPPSAVSYQINIDYSDDTNRPVYHAVPEYGWANESYGLIYHQNKYHMFYQKNDVFLGIAQQNWGHFTSSDLVNWDEQNAVLWPDEGWDQVGIWSGCSIILKDGTPAVVYTGVDGVKAGIGTATSANNYQTLHKDSYNPVISQAPPSVNMDFRDPYVWEKDGMYHMIVGSGISSIGGNVVYYKSQDFKNWNYEGIAYQGQKNEGEGQFWEMPVLYEFPNGKEMLLVQKTPDDTPAITTYWIGQFENGVFTPDFEQPKNLEVVNGFLSPTVTKDAQGRITAIGIIPDEVDATFQMEQGWANLFSVPQVWGLDADNTILIKPHPNLEGLRGTQSTFNNLTLEIGGTNYFNNYNGRHFEVDATINTGDADQVGFIFGKSPDGQEEYKVYYNFATQKWGVDASKSSLSSKVRKDVRTGNYAITQGATIHVRVFVDGSVLEVFMDDKAHFTGRFFPTLANATGVDMFVNGGTATADVTIYELTNDN